jgi:hypothetical protein
LLEHAIPGHVIDVVVRVVYEFDGQGGELADFAEELLCGFGIFEGVDDGYAVVADDEAGVGPASPFASSMAAQTLWPNGLSVNGWDAEGGVEGV